MENRGTRFDIYDENTLSKLKKELEVVFDSKYSLLGHGTAEYNAQKILKEGLESRGSNLSSTTISLFYNQKSYENQPDECFETFLNWPHRNYKYIVIVSIPNPPPDTNKGLSYFNSVFEELPNEKIVDVGIQGADKKYVIPPKFIKGYLDVCNLKFIENKRYDSFGTVDFKPVITNHLGKFRNRVKKQIPIPTPSNEEFDCDKDIW